MSNFWLWMIAYVVIGAMMYVVDRLHGSRVYRWGYGMFHKNPLDPAMNRGFVYNRNMQTRVIVALLLTGLQSILMSLFSTADPLMEFLTLVFEILAMLAGFYVGQLVLFPVWMRRGRILETADKLESGEISIPEKVKGLAQGAQERIRGMAHENMTEEPPPVSLPVEPEKPKEPEVDPYEAIRRYTEGR